MPLKRRPTKAGVYHIAVRSPTPELFFVDNEDRMSFLTILQAVTKNVEWTCLAVCLLGTHYHLLVDAGQGVLPDAMQRINWRYAFDFNQAHGHKGHHVGGKYLSIPVESDVQLLTCYRYIVLNPVRAGLVERAEQWPWSSYVATIGEGVGYEFVDSSRILDRFSTSRQVAIERLRGFVETPWVSRYPFECLDEVSDTWGVRSVGHWA
jgi:REP-associated tyrosine transposase